MKTIPHQASPGEYLRLVIGAMRTGALSNDEAAAALSKLDGSVLAETLVDVVCRAEGARPLFCDQDGYVDGKEPGWFDVDAYSHKDLWEGPDAHDGGLDGFCTLEAAIEFASSPEMSEFYEVVISAHGEHADYEPGERVWNRYNRPYVGESNQITDQQRG